jgi:hypothetical protein
MEKEVAPSLVKRIAGMLLVALFVSLVAMAQQPAPQSGSTTTSAPKNEFFAGYSWSPARLLHRQHAGSGLQGALDLARVRGGVHP